MAAEGKNASPPAQWRVPQWFADIDTAILEKLRLFHSELVFFNRKLNLVSPRTEAESDLIHIADAIFASKLILSATKQPEIYDIGSGNGIPGVVLAILGANRSIKLVDSDTRKIEFLKHCISKLGLKNCTAVHARVEELQEGAIRCGVLRGFASVAKTLLSLRRVAAVGCELYQMKGDSWASEVAEIPAQILASWEPKFIGDYVLPGTTAKLSVIVTIRK